MSDRPFLPAGKLVPPSRSQLLATIDRQEKRLRALAARLDLPTPVRAALLQMANTNFRLLFLAGRRK